MYAKQRAQHLTVAGLKEKVEQGDKMKMLEYTERSELIESACYLYKRLFIPEDSGDSEMEINEGNPDDPGMYYNQKELLTLSAYHVLALPMGNCVNS